MLANPKHESRDRQPGGFLPLRYMRPRHTELCPDDRGRLHDLLQLTHRAIHAGRDDIANPVAEAAARICRELSRW
ncbi:MAG: hypothetical protein V3W34_03355 [Phycisphaerae bacterium]